MFFLFADTVTVQSRYMSTACVSTVKHVLPVLISENQFPVHKDLHSHTAMTEPYSK